jgi:prolyl-tRNA synthetase
MRYSQLFGKTISQAPKDEKTQNAQLLARAGFVNKLMAGVYSYLPLGLRVINKIENIVREEMNKIGGQEIFLPALHPAENWKKSQGWETIDILFKIKSRTDKDYALGQSHEEVITPLFKTYVSSYKDLPIALYQIQQKFRDELRAKSGLLRGREFRMKDMYSWHQTQLDFEKFYSQIKKAYLKIFQRCGLTAKVTEASGGAFSKKISYEFMVLTEAGEDNILYCPKCEHCVNNDIAKNIKESDSCPKCHQAKLRQAKASEVGNVFDLGQRYSQIFELKLTDKNGQLFYPIMGCYGIGISRLMGVIAEALADKNGLVWPKTVAPYLVHLVGLNLDQSKVKEQVEKVYQKLVKAKVAVLYDDRVETGAGAKFADADLIGLPYRLVVSAKTQNQVEIKPRTKNKASLVSFENLLQEIG